jgi:hypothetical protein
MAPLIPLNNARVIIIIWGLVKLPQVAGRDRCCVALSCNFALHKQRAADGPSRVLLVLIYLGMQARSYFLCSTICTATQPFLRLTRLTKHMYWYVTTSASESSKGTPLVYLIKGILGDHVRFLIELNFEAVLFFF